MAQTFSATLFKDQNFLVVGLGHNGLAAVRALLAMGARVSAWDDGQPFAGMEHPDLTYARPDRLTGFDALILSPGIPHLLPSPHPLAALAHAEGIPILSDAEILYRAVRQQGIKARFVSVTGTNGKSTTTALIAHILEGSGMPVAAGGNLGPAALALPLLGDDGTYVIEMSSYMLERLDRYHAAAACLLNLTPDHIERHGDMRGYARAKKHVFDNMTADDCAIVSIDDAESRQILIDLRDEGLSPLSLSITQSASISPDQIDLAQAPALPGRHNLQNALAAFAITQFLGLSTRQIIDGFKTFPGLPHRQEIVAQAKGVAFVNDSKATNAESSEKALACYDHAVWIAGGQAKSGGIEALKPFLNRVAKAFLIGQDADILAGTLSRASIPWENSFKLEAAMDAAFAYACDHGISTVLFSPACASFDQFKNFEARGDAFRAHAQFLAAGCDSNRLSEKGGV